MHGLALDADEDGDFVAVFFDADALRHDAVEAAAEAVLHVGDGCALLRTPGQMNHAGAVLTKHGFLGVVVEALADDEDDFAVVVAFGIGKAGAGGKRDIARHLLPEEAELIARVPDVVAGGGDGVRAGGSIECSAAGDDGRADIRLTFKDADGRADGCGGPMEICGRRHLGVRGGAGLSPVWH